MTFFIFILVALIVMADGCYYIGKRLITPLSISKRSKKLSWWIWCSFFSLLVLAMFLFRLVYGAPLQLTYLTYFLLGWIFNLLVILLARDVVELPVNIFLRIQARFKKKTYVRFLIVRKAAIWSLFVPSLALLLMVAGLVQAYSDPEILEVEVGIQGLHKNFDGFSIVQVSDLHAGSTVGTAYVENVVNIVNSLKPSMIAITGDMVEGRVDHIGKEVKPLESLKAEHGAFWVGGNHENYWDYTKWMENAMNSGFRVLHNSHIRIKVGDGCLVIAGVPDEKSHGQLFKIESSSKKAIEGSANCPKILLSHRAEDYAIAQEAGYDLVLTGHTHGGQFFPFNFIVNLVSPFPPGLHKAGSMWVYVNKGAGWWGPPTRLGVSNEITKLVLRSL